MKVIIAKKINQYQDCDCDIVQFSDPIVYEDDDVDLEDCQGTLIDPDHEGKQVTGQKARQAYYENNWAPLVVSTNWVCQFCQISTVHFSI